MQATHTIPCSALAVVAMSARMRHRNAGATALFCALTPAPVLHLNCGRTSPSLRAQAAKMAPWQYTGPMPRGHIAQVVERTRVHRGLAEVRRTWHAGLRTLRAEPAHILHGGRA